MYKLALVLSTVPSVNVFRAALAGAFHSGSYDEFLICSGFFHERINKRGRFFASDAFVNARLPDPSSVTVVGAYDPASHEFDSFASTLASNLLTVSGAPVTVQRRYSKKRYTNHWHAKIFIARAAGRHTFAIVGSSNLTRSAFDLAPSNNEADVIIWDDADMHARRIAESALAGEDSNAGAVDRQAPAPQIVVSDYAQDDARNSDRRPMSDRLGMLWNDVLGATA